MFEEEFRELCKDEPQLAEIERMLLSLDTIMEDPATEDIWAYFAKKWMQSLVGFESHNPKMHSSRKYEVANNYLYTLVQIAEEKLEAKRIAAQ